jgi:hypothetical protein
MYAHCAGVEGEVRSLRRLIFGLKATLNYPRAKVGFGKNIIFHTS